MPSFRCALCLSLLAGLSTIVLAASSKSPTIIVNGDGPPPTPVMTNTFAFGSDAQGGGDFSYVNDSGEVWTRLDFFFTLPLLETINCNSNVYGPCTVVTSTHVAYNFSPVSYDLIFGPNPNGFANGRSFTVDLNNNGSTEPDGSGYWPADTDFTAVANLPEPSSFVLGALGLLLGLSCLLLRRFRAKATL